MNTSSNAPVAIVGLWHLGCVTAAGMAELGHSVIGIEPTPARLAALREGRPPLHEPGLSELLLKQLSAGRLRFEGSFSSASSARFLFVAHDTPVDENDDVSLVELDAALEQAAPHLQDRTIVVVISQVPLGTCDAFAARLRALRPEITLGVAYVPENLRLGQALERFLRPEFLVVGGEDGWVREAVSGLFAPTHAKIVGTDLGTAEMSKHALNAYLATQVSFINELARVGDALGADVKTVGDILRLDGRVGPKALLSPGAGFSGATLARDVKVLRRLASEGRVETKLLDGVWSVNETQNRNIIARLLPLLPTDEEPRVCFWGLTYKPGTSTLRRSGAIEMASHVRARGARIRAFDPMAAVEELPPELGVEVRADPYAACEGADAIVLATNWPEFHQVDWARVRQAVRRPLFVDTGNFFDPASLTARGFTVLSVGRGRSL
jgi:UDPglucose 6-dehydrogenase